MLRLLAHPGGFFVVNLPAWISWLKYLSYIYYALGGCWARAGRTHPPACLDPALPTCSLLLYTGPSVSILREGCCSIAGALVGGRTQRRAAPLKHMARSQASFCTWSLMEATASSTVALTPTLPWSSAR